MRWVFIRPCNRSPYYDPEIQEPLGLEYLAACRRARGDCVLVLDSSLDGLTDTRLARRAAGFQPDAVGFSITTAQEITSVLAVHQECVRVLQDKPVRWLAGGNYVSTEPQRALRLLPPAFSLVQFEGEQALEELTRLWAAPAASAVGDGHCVTERLFTGRAVEDLDSLPFPVRLFSHAILPRGWPFNLQGSRGCCGACRYCASPGMSEGHRRWRGRSPEGLAEEIDHLYRSLGARSFNFVDEDFLGPGHLAPLRARRFAEELQRRNLRISFGIQVRPASLCEETISLLTSAGLTYVFMGIESDNPDDFRRWGRPWTDDPWRLVAHVRQGGAEINAGVLLFHSHATLSGIRRFAGQLHEHRLLDFRSATNRLDAMPGSEFHALELAAGRIDAETSGPQPLPYVHAEVEALHRDLLAALEPIGPPSMHAVCSWPPLLARWRLDPRMEPARRELTGIIHRLDDHVAETLFLLLDLYEGRTGLAPSVQELRQRSLEVAIEGARDLARKGFASSFEQLREAIRIDSGL